MRWHGRPRLKIPSSPRKHYLYCICIPAVRVHALLLRRLLLGFPMMMSCVCYIHVCTYSYAWPEPPHIQCGRSNKPVEKPNNTYYDINSTPQEVSTTSIYIRHSTDRPNEVSRRSMPHKIVCFRSHCAWAGTPVACLHPLIIVNFFGRFSGVPCPHTCCRTILSRLFSEPPKHTRRDV